MRDILEEIAVQRMGKPLGEAVGDYSASYGDAAYSLGFHDGMEAG